MLDKYSESEVHVEVVEERPTSSIAFGLERIGLIAVKAPVLSVIILFALMVAIPFLLVHAFLQARASEIVDSLEAAKVSFLNMAQTHIHEAAPAAH